MPLICDDPAAVVDDLVVNVVTIVAPEGGMAQEVERFAVQGVRTQATSPN
jgi:hypothetical protein